MSILSARGPEKITDELIGEADRVCACSAIVGDIIRAANDAEEKKAAFKEILDLLRQKEQERGQSG